MLELEINESTIMDDPAAALDVLTRLHELGMPIHIDDFGTGYSSLGYLHILGRCTCPTRHDLRILPGVMNRDCPLEKIGRSARLSLSGRIAQASAWA